MSLVACGWCVRGRGARGARGAEEPGCVLGGRSRLPAPARAESGACDRARDGPVRHWGGTRGRFAGAGTRLEPPSQRHARTAPQLQDRGRFAPVSSSLKRVCIFWPVSRSLKRAGIFSLSGAALDGPPSIKETKRPRRQASGRPGRHWTPLSRRLCGPQTQPRPQLPIDRPASAAGRCEASPMLVWGLSMIKANRYPCCSRSSLAKLWS